MESFANSLDMEEKLSQRSNQDGQKVKERRLRVESNNDQAEGTYQATIEKIKGKFNELKANTGYQISSWCGGNRQQYDIEQNNAHAIAPARLNN